MALAFQPKVGSVLMCDFVGFIEPEMVKKRPVVVIARNRKNKQLVTIVPLSTTAPDILEIHHYKLPFNPVPMQHGVPCWAKCDMISTVSIERLDRLKKSGVRSNIDLDHQDINAIRLCVMHALQLQNVVIDLQSETEIISIVSTETIAVKNDLP